MGSIGTTEKRMRKDLKTDSQIRHICLVNHGSVEGFLRDFIRGVAVL